MQAALGIGCDNLYRKINGTARMALLGFGACAGTTSGECITCITCTTTHSKLSNKV